MTLAYTVKRSKRAKLARVIVTADKVEVVVPLGTPAQWVQQWVHSKQAWIANTSAKLRAQASQTPSLAPLNYVDGMSVPFAGQHYPLQVITTTLKRAKLEFNAHFIVSIPHTLTAAEHSTVIKTLVWQWLKNSAKQRIEQIIARHAPRRQLFPGKLALKTQKSRWGSCSTQNNININWLLILAPPEILEYVVVHELCHIREKNHSAQFWALVAEHLPHYQQQRDWLKRHGTTLKL